MRDSGLAISDEGFGGWLSLDFDRAIRDLKPANVQIRADGTLKVLDFGLAVSPAPRPADLANSPTFTSPVPMTQAGIILGTAAYMAPEQARGKPIDRRADVWAFGCVLFEMLSGAQAFDGESMADVIGAIVSRDPDWARLPADTPSGVRDVLAMCLQRDPANRLKDLGDVAMLLSTSIGGGRERRVPPTTRSSAVTFAGWAVAAAVALFLVWDRTRAPEPSAPRSMRFELPLSPPAEARQQQMTSSFALSPDGTRLVYVGRQGSATTLFLHDLESGQVRTLPDTTDGSGPFFSPDGAQVPTSDLQVVPIEPGAPPKVVGAPRSVAALSGIGITASFSPDSQWIAWCDCVVDQTESKVFITRIGDGRRYQVSVDGGSEPTWSASGREIFFRQGPSMMVVEVATGADVTIGRPRKLIDGESLGWRPTGYDLARDGRFVVVRSPSDGSSGRALSVRLNWVEELKKLKF